jgi:hypothetical protein
VQLADDFHDALSAATLLPRSATDTLLATIEAIPQSEYRSFRDVQFTQTFNNFASKLPEGTLCHSKYLQANPATPTFTPTTPSPEDKLKKTKSGKAARRRGGSVTPAPEPELTVSITNPNVVTPATPAAGNTTLSMPFCIFYQSTKGCYKRVCQWPHACPPRGAPVRKEIKKLLTAKGLSPSPEFLKEE